jgi:acyl-CoA thioester hydrolase
MARKEGKSWVSSSNQIAYLKPALLSETVIIESQLISFDTSDLKVEMRMYNADKSNLKSIIWCNFVHFNLLEQKRQNHNESLMQLFKSIEKPINIVNFEERIIQLKPTFIAEK